MKYAQIAGWIAIGAILALMFTNAEIKSTGFHQVATQKTEAGTEVIETFRTEWSMTPTEEFKPLNLFGDEKPKE